MVVAVLLDSVVVNIVRLEPGSAWKPGRGLTTVETPAEDGSRAMIGGAWTGKTFLPSPPVEQEVTLEERVGALEDAIMVITEGKDPLIVDRLVTATRALIQRLR